MTLCPLKISADLTDCTTRAADTTAIAHAKTCARGLSALLDQPLLGTPDYAQRPEALVTSYTVAFGEARDELREDGEVVTGGLPARVTATLAVPADWSFEQVEQALRNLGDRIHGAAQREQGASAVSGLN